MNEWIVTVLFPGTKRHSMDYHSEVEIHEGEDGGIVMDIQPKKNRGTGSDIKQYLQNWDQKFNNIYKT